jgi:hypothetical protein
VLEVSMSKASGVLLIALGVGVAAYAMPSSDQGGDQQPAQEISLAKAAPIEPAGVSTAVGTSKAALPEVVPPIPKPAVRPVKDTAQPNSPTTTPTKPTVIATAPRSFERPLPAEPKASPTFLPGDRVGLARELQRELRRVGCYDAEVNGTWTPSSRRAMKAFTDRVNASLPVDQPDYILLKLVQGSSERVCGAGCPAGQGMAADGRCLPNAVIANAPKKGSLTQPAMSGNRPADHALPATSGWATTTTVATREMPVAPEGRMALAGPGNEPAATSRPGSVENLGMAPESGATKSKAGAQRKTNVASVDNSDRRYAPEPRRKFGPWFFREMDASRR